MNFKMKNITYLFLVLLIVTSCKESAKEVVSKKTYPENLENVFDKHGGIDNWNKLKTLSFKTGEELHTIDLHSRKTKVASSKYAYGFDGKEIWVSDTVAFKKDPKFYYNLFFYFYAMPFVLADDGIVYSEADSIEFEGKKYVGIKISYKQNVGSSPDDNYHLYFDTETYQMKWLKYSVTYFSKKASNKFNLIKYDNWSLKNGFLLPDTLIWYKQDENGNPLEPARAPMQFELKELSTNQLEDTYYQKPIS
jgi:hypothetical protein